MIFALALPCLVNAYPVWFWLSNVTRPGQRWKHLLPVQDVTLLPMSRVKAVTRSFQHHERKRTVTAFHYHAIL